MTPEHVVPAPGVQLYNADCREVMKQLPDNSIDLIATDPPYFKVKADAWDNQWRKEDDFLNWLDDILAEFHRVLKPSGSLYLFCSDRMAGKVEMRIGKRFRLLNHIVWRKPSGVFKRHRKESLRQFLGQTERILFAEHYNAESAAKGQSGYISKCIELKAHVFEPLIAYFREAKAKAGIASKDIDAATGTQMSTHWFTSSQWKLPTREQYEILQRLFAERAAELPRGHGELTQEYGELQRTYSELKRDYEELRQEYESLRRPFSVNAAVPYTDVWDFRPVEHYPSKHPCEKPLDMMRHIVQASTRPGQVVFDPFMGSGSTGKACIELGRKFIGVDMDEAYFKNTLQSLSEHQAEPLKEAG
ncbi:site-specific DNA-methyltransferase [Hahella sp. HN01]|uniref:DNA-methyltransferase n=1 Tax=Hahella sp. HN01 TaxID=2847262 RepID=UPI001C1EAF42|nr:site-specific DNA-methyltransferase [Hahella sp. HN01]MBU6955748.1 site-specific DNA-methyltransferase [Hahella sp. HN01]